MKPMVVCCALPIAVIKMCDGRCCWWWWSCVIIRIALLLELACDQSFTRE